MAFLPSSEMFFWAAKRLFMSMTAGKFASNVSQKLKMTGEVIRGG
jgi:hypothetical protein